MISRNLCYLYSIFSLSSFCIFSFYQYNLGDFYHCPQSRVAGPILERDAKYVIFLKETAEKRQNNSNIGGVGKA